MTALMLHLPYHPGPPTAVRSAASAAADFLRTAAALAFSAVPGCFVAEGLAVFFALADTAAGFG